MQTARSTSLARTPNQTLDPETIDAEIISDEAYQEAQAQRVEDTVFGNAANAQKSAAVIRDFVDSYERHKHSMALDAWLIEAFKQYPDIWRDEAELIDTAHEVIATVRQQDEAHVSLYQHLERGKSKESWLAQRIEQGAGLAGVAHVGVYAGNIEQSLIEANESSMKAIFTQSGTLNQNPSLHGYLAETDMANRFNIEAVTANSPVRAEVLGSNGLNSADLVILDAAGQPVQNVQLKSYSNTQALLGNLQAHDYPPGTVLVVHEDQVEAVQKAFPHLKVTSSLEIDGVKVDMLDYEALKERQRQAQEETLAREYEWNDVNRINIAKNIGKQAAFGAVVVAGMQGVRILGRRVWNFLSGKKNPPASEDLQEFFTSSIKSGGHIGIQTAVSGGVVVAVKNGWLGAVLKATPVGRIVNIVNIGLQNAKILFQLGQGKIDAIQAADMIGNTTCSAVGGLSGAGLGMMKGAAIGTVLGPVGTVVGGFVGSLVGGIAGSKIGEAVYAGGKAIVKTAVSMVKTAVKGVVEGVKSVARVLNPLNWF